MAYPQRESLRALTASEFSELERVSRSSTDEAGRVSRARVLAAVASGKTFAEAARASGRRSPQGVGFLVGRFNLRGLSALDARHGGGQRKRYGSAAEQRILREVQRAPDRETDGTATWSLTTLQRALRQAPDGLPTVSTSVIWGVLHDAGYSWQRDRSWCETGQAIRKRKSGTVAVRDPDAVPKKTD